MAAHLPPGTLLLDYIRYHRHLTGTKIGCREGDCGACTVLVGELKDGHLAYSSATSCLMALANAAGKHIVTIEGINGQGLNPVQQAMCDAAATQCGFCTPGIVVSLAGFCLRNGVPDSEQAVAAVNGNICRCTGYKSIERAAARVAAIMHGKGESDPVDFVTRHHILPSYFKDIKKRLQAMQLRDAEKSASTGKRFLGGGTDLYVQRPEEMVESPIEPLFSQRALKTIYQEGNKCYVGAAATVTDILLSPVFQHYFPRLTRFIKLVSSTPIRNMATVAGNFVNASPIGDLTIFFLALDAQLVLSDGQNQRVLPLRSFYKGYKQLDKKDEEYIETLFFTLPGERSRFNFEKVSKRTHLDIASVNTAIHLELSGDLITQAGIAAGGVGPVPLYLQKASEFLRGKEVSEEVVLEAVEIARLEIAPISDVRGSVEYKRLLLRQLIKAHFIELFPSLSTEKLVAIHDKY